MRSAAIITMALFVLAGCKNQSSSYTSSSNSNTSTAASAAQTNLSPEQLGEIGAKIKKHPKEARSILSQKGLTEQQFEQAVRKVAESPADSKRYATAYKRAS